MIDIHSHFFPRISQAEARAVDAERAPWLTVDADGRTGQIMLGDRPFRPVHDELWDPDARVRGLDAAGISLQIVCATPVMSSTISPGAALAATTFCKRKRGSQRMSASAVAA